MPKVLISDELSPRAVEIFKERGVDVDVKVGLKPDQLRAIVGDYDGLAIRSATKVTAEVLAVANKLKVVGRAGIGVDNVDIKAATARGVVVMNTPFGNAITTAEHAIALMFAVARQVPAADASTQAGKWEKNRFMGAELSFKTLGLIGCGNIGGIVAERAIGLKMRVAAYDPFLSEERAKALGVDKVTLDELIARADFISIHTPLTDQTKNILSRERLMKTRKGVRIVNCARGGLVDELAVRDLLISGHIAGAAFDVFAEEPAKQNVLFGAPNLVCTPHLGASTLEAQENVALQVAEQMSDYLMTGAVVNSLNMPNVSAEDAPRLAPYLKLAENLGSFAGQLTESGIKAVSIEYEGAVAALNVKPLTQAAITGLLRPQLENVNMVNAPIVARERGVDVAEVKHDRDSDYQTQITITVTTERRTRSVSGTLFGGKHSRLVNIKGIEIEAEFAARMLYITNDDKPGFIGRLGALLGDAGVNIATFHLGRDKPGGEAIALVAVDQKLDATLVERIGQLDGVTQAKALAF
ncbi:phosphoglycerate dehydrogenase [Reyranella sp. CPCC 100927]|uniref:phosphoglycerate dehydrogenase n=1 Tax=Reyranella sp. CPCC 100927 TaxID=2599616 RepID=UPI0011B730C9|nr:phosphoglycerate dehydrogenase [Reyranella sp. CPCC 100927]TWT13502.1 phosphoglycerate dehydrogenase [Reyranella sp. CPCC 100927]